MKRNPYQEAAAIEETIVELHKRLRKKESRASELVGKLKSIDPNHRKCATYRKQLKEQETDIARTRERLKKAVKAKRKREAEGKKLQFGNKKNEIAWRDTNREITQEIRKQQVLLQSLRNVQLELKKDANTGGLLKYDLFISHASEDKEQLVRPLAESLTSQGLAVWYDELSLTIGDSLRKSIDHGLSNSRFGLVVLSSDFFAKNWTQYELNGLVSREMEGKKVILPLWHKVTKNDVMRFSPSMVDKVALNTSLFSIEEIAEKIALAVRSAEPFDAP